MSRLDQHAIIVGGTEGTRTFEPPDYVVYNTLIHRSVHLLIGPPKHGKSYVATTLAWACSGPEHSSFFNKPVDIYGPIIYVAAEGAIAQEMRFEALRQKHGNRDHPIYLLKCKVNLSNPGEARELADYVKLRDGVMIVIDTANACGAGKEDTEAMNAFAHGLGLLQNYTKATTVVLHHSPQADATRPRGSTVLPALVDSWWTTAKDKDGLFKLSAGEGRASATLASDSLGEFRLETYRLLDENDMPMSNVKGRPVEVGVVVEAGEFKAKQQPSKCNEAAAKAQSKLYARG